jgi:Midasin AAA lid domain
VLIKPFCLFFDFTISCITNVSLMLHGMRLYGIFSCCIYRDLIKWCTRLERHIVERRSKLTTDVLFTEAVDCFCANLPLSMGHVQLAKDIGKHLNFSHTEVSHSSHFLMCVDELV